MGSIHQGVLADFNPDLSRTCPHCGSAEATSWHNWVCTHPSIVDARQRDADGLQQAVLNAIPILPAPLLHGNVPSMQIDPRLPYWQGRNTPSTNMQGLDAATEHAIGANVQHNLVLSEDLANLCHDTNAMDAHQAYRWLNHQDIALSDCSIPLLVRGTPPGQINAYSDGSLLHPERPEFSIGPAGVLVASSCRSTIYCRN